MLRDKDNPMKFVPHFTKWIKTEDIFFKAKKVEIRKTKDKVFIQLTK